MSEQPDPSASSARHEIRNLINHILGSAQLLLEEVGDLEMPDLVREMEEIRADGRRTLRLAEQLFAGDLRADVRDAAKTQLGQTARRISQRWAIVRHRLHERDHADLILDRDPIDSAAKRIQLYAAQRGGQGVGGPLVALDGQEPRTPAVVAIPPRPDEVQTEAEPEGGRILVVDDNPANRGILSRRLERLGYEALKAGDGAHALQLLDSSEIDLVLLDMMMPGMSGFDVLERRRRDPKLRAIPFIVISALDEADSVIRCIEMGAEDYLLKPFDPVLLRARVKACLEKKRLVDQQARYLATIEAQAAELAELNRTLKARVASQVQDIERLSRLQRFLPPQIAEAIISSGEEMLEPHRRDITVAFCDLRGFTAFAEAAEPDEVMNVLREYHEAVGDLIFQLEGTLEHFAGDGIMVFFNDPVPCSDPALRAVHLGLGVRERIIKLAADWRRRGHQLGFGMGIASGEATIGPIGFESRFDYAAIGSVANLAARLCGDAEPGQILVTERVCAATAGIVRYTPVGELQLKGFRQPIAAFNVERDVQGWTLAGGEPPTLRIEMQSEAAG